MKTLTEFAGLNIKNAAKTKQELIAGGKTPEELTAALGEALKVEGDRLTFLVNVLEFVGTKQNDLKRVVVFSLAEGEKAPLNAVQKGEHYYLIEYFPSMNQEKPRASQDDRPGGRDRKGKGKRGERGDRGGDRKRTSPRPGGDEQRGQGPAGSNPQRAPRPPRPAAVVTQGQAPTGKPPVITPKKPIPPKAPAEEKVETPSETKSE